MTARQPHLYLVDGSGYIFRAYHKLPPMTDPQGTPVNAVFGFTTMLWKLIEDLNDAEHPTHLAVVLDAARRSFRNDIYPAYKAHRPDPPEDLVPQFPLIRDAVRAFSVPCIELPGFEADDILATYATQALAQGFRVTIVSSDKDLMQLIQPGLDMRDPLKNVVLGPEAVIEKFGVPPEKVVDVQALAGDSVDNVPGAPGIGLKTAALLINEYGDVETLLSRAGEIKQEKRRQSLIEFAEQARISKRLVCLDDKAPVHIPLEDLRMSDPNGKQIVSFLKAMEFTSLTKRVAEATDTNIELVEADPELRPGDNVIGKLKAEGEAEVSGEAVHVEDIAQHLLREEPLGVQVTLQIKGPQGCGPLVPMLSQKGDEARLRLRIFTIEAAEGAEEIVTAALQPEGEKLIRLA